MRAYIVDAQAVKHNLTQLRQRAGKARILAVLKGDGYGLGLMTMAQLCRDNGVDAFAVTEPNDARRLRESGNAEELILMLRPTVMEEELRMLIAADAICTVGSLHHGEVLSQVAKEMDAVVKVHLKLDTGMGRYGFIKSQMQELLDCYALENLDICGLYTHFHSAFCNRDRTALQAARLLNAAAAIRDAGHDPGMVHCANSSALMKYPEYAMDAVRVGSAILGRLAFKTELKKVGYCRSSLEEVRVLPKGHTCGYGAAWTAKKDTRIAIIPVGWYHGFAAQTGQDTFRVRDCLRQMLSALKNLVMPGYLTVRVGDTRCRVLGHVGMLHTVIDITDKKVREGDTCTLEINPCRVRGMEIRMK